MRGLWPGRGKLYAPDVEEAAVREVAEHLRVCTAIVYAMVKDGKLPHVRVSNMIRIPAPVVAGGGDVDAT